jgi:phosphate regulon transcriptional regulator PhoB
MKKTIIVVDDEKDITDLVAYNLEQEGYKVFKAYDGLSAWNAIRLEKFDLALIDLMMPGISGFELCKRIRSSPSWERLPIIMLTAKSDQVDKVLGLELGADDYITKPFHVRELIARIRAVLRRAEYVAEDGEAEKLQMDGIDIDLRSYEVKIEGRSVDLSSHEFRLLRFFIEHPGRVYTRNQLLDYVWGDEVFVEPRTVDAHISRLRTAIEPDKKKPRYIQTIRGIGYKFGDTL